MSIKFSKRAASGILKRGEGTIRIKSSALESADKAITKDDVRDLVKSGDIYALPMKKNMSLHGKLLRIKRAKGRRRGMGRRKGTLKSRNYPVYKQKIRGQRRVVKALKADKTIDNEYFKKIYLLVKGGTFANKVTLLNHIRSDGIQIPEEKFEKLRHS
jgi:large subunit ribosomal protein L19e